MTDEARLDELLIYGSCDGALPLCAPKSMAHQTMEHEGRTYWVPTRDLKGMSLVEVLKDAQDKAAFVAESREIAALSQGLE